MALLTMMPAHATVITGMSTVINCQMNVPCQNQDVAEFMDDNPLAAPSDFTATINWGDGSPVTNARIGQTDTVFIVLGDHTYTAPGVFTITVVINDVPPGTGTATVVSTANVTSVPPTISKMFGNGTIPIGSTTSLTFNLTNPSTLNFTGVGFTDTLPVGLLVSTPNGLTGSCGSGVISASGNSISLTGGTIGAGGSCTFSVNVTALGSGMLTNTTSAVTSNQQGNGNMATATLNVAPAVAPTLSKAFGNTLVGVGSTTALTFTIQNPNLVPSTGIAFTDPLPSGLIVATPNGVTGSCGLGTITANPGSSSIMLTGGTLLPNSSCTFTVNVKTTMPGTLMNTTLPITAAGVPAGNVAIAALFVGTTFPATLDYPFQTKIFPNLAAGDSVINIGNTGASAPGAGGATIGGNLCVNVYVFSPDEQEVACCTCYVTPNGVQTTTVRQLTSKTLTPAVPTAVTVKMIATDGTAGAASCNASALGTPAIGLLAFGTNVHAALAGGSNSPGTYAITETPFIPSTLSTAEVTRITSLCGFIQSNGTGFGVCPGCVAGAAGSVRQ